MLRLGVFLIIYACWCSSPEPSRRAGQLHPGQSAGDAAAYRAGMVLPAVLRDPACVPNKLGGVVLMFASILVCSCFRGSTARQCAAADFGDVPHLFWLLVLDAVVLGVVGANPPEGNWILFGRMATIWYFVHFLIVLPLLSRLERPRPLPISISQSVLASGGGFAPQPVRTMDKA
jgi:hypothetical protein